MKVCSEFFLEFYWLESNFGAPRTKWKHIRTFLLLYHWLLTRMTSKSLALWPLFFRTFKLTGPFVTMIYKMLLGDLLRFGIIYVIFLTGFTQGSYCTLMPTSFLVDHFCFLLHIDTVCQKYTHQPRLKWRQKPRNLNCLFYKNISWLVQVKDETK